MATISTKREAVTYVLELTEAEAEYVMAALQSTDPTRDLGEGVGFDTVHEALANAGVAWVADAAQ